MRLVFDPGAAIRKAETGFDWILQWIEHNGDVSARLIALLIFTVGLLNASATKFWFDEIVTFHLAKLDNFGSMVRAVLNASDTVPPLFHWLESWPLRIFPRAELGLRILPAAGVATAAASVYFFLRRCCGPLAALVGALFPGVSLALRYASEARPYGILLGCCGVAALAWQRAAGSRAAGWWLVAALGLAAAIHPYTIFVIAAFAAAEAWRVWTSRTIRWPVVAALALSTLIILLELPFLLTARREFSLNYWAPTTLTSFSYALALNFGDLWRLLAPFLAWLGISWILEHDAASERVPRDQHSSGNTTICAMQGRAEACLGVALMAVFPIIAFLALKLFRGGMAGRYILPVTLGAAILLGLAASRLPRRHAAAILVLLLVLHGVQAASAGRDFIRSMRQHNSPDTVDKWIHRAYFSSMPIVIVDGIAFLERWHHTPHEAQKFMYYLTDRARAVAATGTDSVDLTLERFSKIVPVNVVPYGQFLAQAPRFLVLTSNRENAWGDRDLVRDGCTLVLLDAAGAHRLFSADCGRKMPRADSNP